jgi:hypothetical protein
MNCLNCESKNDMECESRCWKCGQKLARKYRRLEEGEIVLATDEIYDDHVRQWVEPNWSVGKPAPDPAYTSHRQFRRKINSQPNAIGEARADNATSPQDQTL